jgi:hypothetical protein
MIVEEFYLQGEQEKRLGIPISPSMDRQTTSQGHISIQFNDLIARPYFEALVDVLDPMECFVDLLKSNRIEWLRLMEVSKEVKFAEEEEESTVKAVSRGRGGRRMSTAAGTVHIPTLVMRKRAASQHNRHSFCALSVEKDVVVGVRHSYQEESFTPDASGSK